MVSAIRAEQTYLASTPLRLRHSWMSHLSAARVVVARYQCSGASSTRVFTSTEPATGRSADAIERGEVALVDATTTSCSAAPTGRRAATGS